jgi:hypothetical protein
MIKVMPDAMTWKIIVLAKIGGNKLCLGAQYYQPHDVQIKNGQKWK